MVDITFYNWERKPIMQWTNFIWNESEEENIVCFDVKFSLSIFCASTKIETHLIDVVNLHKNLLLLYQQKLSTVVFTSLNEMLEIKLRREKSGHIYQTFIIKEPGTKSCLTAYDYFDQTFLPELEDDIKNALIIESDE